MPFESFFFVERGTNRLTNSKNGSTWIHCSAGLGMCNVPSWELSPHCPRLNGTLYDLYNQDLVKIFRKVFRNFFRIFFDCFENFSYVSFFQIFPEIGRAETIRLVQKSSNFELSSRFFGRLKTETKPSRLY